MTLREAAVLRPGDWVVYDGGEHQVVALAGTSVRLRSGDGGEQVVVPVGHEGDGAAALACSAVQNNGAGHRDGHPGGGYHRVDGVEFLG